MQKLTQLMVIIIGAGLLTAACGASATSTPVPTPKAPAVTTPTAVVTAIPGPEQVSVPTSAAAAAPPRAKMAPDLTLATTDGEFRLSQQKGRVLLLYFSFPG